MASETLIVGHDHVTVDLLLWRRFKRIDLGQIERVLDTNPGLAALGPELPIGTAVVVEIPVPPADRPPVPAIALWD
jgi:phage tail protein X